MSVSRSRGQGSSSGQASGGRGSTSDRRTAHAAEAAAGPRTVGQLASGDVLDGRYRLVTRIGRGGFGDVWRAVELLPDGAPLRDVALKLLSPEIADSDWAEEAKLLASFSHPSLVTIYAAGVLENLGAPFVAMELLLGETLAEALRGQKRIPWRIALRYAREVAQALDVIHVRGVVHLDLKPANIFVTEEGRVKVLDFGISRSQSGKQQRDRLPTQTDQETGTMPTAVFLAESSDPFAATQRAATGEVAGRAPERVVVGTPGFVAPEVLELGEPTMLADAYALGATIAVLATGRLPQAVASEPADDADAHAHRAYWLELREATLRGSLRDLSDAGLPRGLVALIERLCAVDPQRRRVTEGALGKVIEEVWLRPHGTPRLPYPGLAAFGPEHEGFLFGRDHELVRMTRHLSFESLLVIAGPSGAGKTSFVASLLSTELAKAGVDGRLDVMVAHVSAAEGPDRALDRALGLLALDAGAEAWAALFRADDQRARVLVVDDVESVLDFPADERSRTVALIERLLEGGEGVSAVGGSRVVLLIDQEALDAFIALAPGLSALPALVRYLAPPPEAAARDITLEPARLAGYGVEQTDAIVKAVEAELARGGVPLPAIALLLASCVVDSEPSAATRRAQEPMGLATPAEREVHGRKLDGARLGASGGASGAIISFADQALRAIGGEPEKSIEVLMALTSSEGGSLRVPLALLREKIGGGDVDLTVVRLRKHKLVRMRGGDVELSHPALAKWPKIESARLGKMEQIALFERIAESAAAWERASMQTSYLDRGDLLAGLDRLKLGVRGLSGIELEFLDASRRARRRRRVVTLAALLLGLFVIAVGVSYKRALDERRQQAEEAEQRAEQQARRVGLLARARQASDPYARVAYLVAALRAGASEPALFVELLGAAHNLPPGRFLTLSPVESVAMPWDDRWVVGRSPGGALVVFDLKAPNAEPEVLDHLDVEIDPEKASVVFRQPKRFDLDVGDSPLVDIVPLAFDTALLALDASGTVTLVRLREDGEVRRAAVAPVRCRGELTVAQRAPVAACVSQGGIAVWELATGKSFRIAVEAAGFELSPDGKSLVSWHDRTLSLRATDGVGEPRSIQLSSDIRVASMSPRDAVVAIATADATLVLDAGRLEHELWRSPPTEDTVALRWDDGGLDLAVCKLSGLDHWVFLQKVEGGSRPASLPEPKARCDRAAPSAPRSAASRFELGAFGMKDFGEHFSRGAFELPGHRWLSSTLVLSGAYDDGLEHVLSFELRDDAGKHAVVGAQDGFSRVVRSGEVVAVELSRKEKDIAEHRPPEVLLIDAMTGSRRHTARGFLLGSCPAGRLAAYRVDGARYVVFDVLTGAELGSAAREPGVVVGIAPSCGKLYLQRLDGTLLSATLGESEAPKVLAEARGFAFDVEQSRTFDGGGAGLLVAMSSGELIRIDETSDEVRTLAVASPRPTAIGDGVEPGEALFADATGVFRIRRSGQVESLAGPRSGPAWEDVARAQDGNAVVLASAAELAVVDTRGRAITGSVPIRGLTRLAAWGDDGSILAYAPDLEGIARGVIVPFGAKIPDAVGSLASNLRVDDKGNLILKR